VKDLVIEDSLKRVLESIDSTYEFDSLVAIIIIPEGGCAGCIEKSMDFLRGHNNYFNNVLFIITGVDDKKLTRLRLNDYNLFPSQNLVIDYKNEVTKNGLLSIYPKIFYLKQGVVENIDTSLPQNTEIWIIFKKRMFNRLN